jgi:DNA polymerase I
VSGVLHLVDASYFIFRAYYSVTPEMAGADGRAVNALYGFARFMGDLLERARPSRVAVAFDESLAGSFRNDIYPAYKANREPAPPDLAHQFELCRELCRLLGLAEYASGAYEADDIIGAIATRMRAQGHRSVLVTRDKDLAQLLREGDEFWDFAGDQRFGYHQIAARFGVQPERMADYLALTGDSVDNIPGVPGVGPKTAAVLLGVFESLDQLYARLDEVPALPIRGAAKLPDRLRQHREAAYLAQRLTRIACDMPLAFEAADLARRPPQVAALEDFYDRAGFGPMLKSQARRLAAAMT